MATTHTSLADLFTDIANKIRSKTGSSAALVADEFPTAIESIVTDPSGECTATDNDILAGKTAYAGNQLRTGAIQSWNGEKIPDYLCFTAEEDNCKISIDKSGSPSSRNFQTSVDRFSWTDYVPGTTPDITLVNTGDKVYFKGLNPEGLSETYENYYEFSTTKKAAVSGNIMSLIDGGACNTTTIPNEYCFYKLFNLCYYITTAPKLPATTLADACYASMFRRCYILQKAPELPATTMCYSCYSHMFESCSALTEPPDLPAASLQNGCYSQMFVSCSNLSRAPQLLATVMKESCYEGMFKNCTSLTTVPKLPGTTLDYSCYSQMFYGCNTLQVSDTSTAEATCAWTIPSSGTFTNTRSQASMFGGCAGTRASDNMDGSSGSSYTYYTQNPPV